MFVNHKIVYHVTNHTLVKPARNFKFTVWWFYETIRLCHPSTVRSQQTYDYSSCLQRTEAPLQAYKRVGGKCLTQYVLRLWSPMFVVAFFFGHVPEWIRRCYRVSVQLLLIWTSARCRNFPRWQSPVSSQEKCVCSSVQCPRPDNFVSPDRPKTKCQKNFLSPVDPKSFLKVGRPVFLIRKEQRILRKQENSSAVTRKHTILQFEEKKATECGVFPSLLFQYFY